MIQPFLPRVYRVPCGKRLIVPCLAAMLGAGPLSVTAAASPPLVVTTIKPLHAIASTVMEGVGTPLVLIDGAASPHGFSLKPSQARQLQDADAVFWIGPELTPSLAKPISSMAGHAAVVELMNAKGIEHLSFRSGADFDTNDTGHDHDDGEEGHEDDHHESTHVGHNSDEGHAHESGEDPHIWLNPDNGIAIADTMAATLAKIDPVNAETYRENAARFTKQIKALEVEIQSELRPLADRKFLVFHDAYHHFEHHFGVEASGSITLSPESISSADRLAEAQEKIRELNVVCVFQEPQFDSKLVDVALEDSSARKGTLDPLGTDLTNGPDLYPDLLKNIAGSLADCLGNPS